MGGQVSKQASGCRSCWIRTPMPLRPVLLAIEVWKANNQRRRLTLCHSSSLSAAAFSHDGCNSVIYCQWHNVFAVVATCLLEKLIICSSKSNLAALVRFLIAPAARRAYENRPVSFKCTKPGDGRKANRVSESLMYFISRRLGTNTHLLLGA